ncbi:MAG: hypothetical protein OXF88_11945 [Rhodobacteraceae bacterium]|nr:hypothetical protein [Paracoccaceae bacterium]MCY4141013.1 hypothetical protein [Paracoccaceae bacterium]
MADFEQACNETEQAAEDARKSAARVVSQARALMKAAQTGNVSAIKRCRSKLHEVARELEQDVSNATLSWPYSEEEEADFFGGQFILALKEAANEKGLIINERDDFLVSYPSLLRINPKECAVRLDKKKVATVRPSFLANLLLANQKRKSGFTPARFLESLYQVYRDVEGPKRARRKSQGTFFDDQRPVVPLIRIYKLMTSLPGSAAEYNRTDFARDLYILDSDGPHETRSGAKVAFPSSTGARTRSSDLFTFIGPHGDAEYYGIRFGAEAK